MRSEYSLQLTVLQELSKRFDPHDPAGIAPISENLPQTTYDTVEEDVVRRLDRNEFFRLARIHLSALEAEFLDLMRQEKIHNPSFIDILQRFGTAKTTNREVSNTKERVKYKLASFAHSRGLRLEDYL